MKCEADGCEKEALWKIDLLEPESGKEPTFYFCKSHTKALVRSLIKDQDFEKLTLRPLRASRIIKKWMAKQIPR